MQYNAPTESVRNLFHQGNNARVYEMLGAHPVDEYGRAMWHFAVWAPNALAVSLIGEFCQWDKTVCPMTKVHDGTWEVRLPAETFDPASDPERYQYEDAAEKLKTYKYAVQGADGVWREKTDPFAFRMQLRPNNASEMYDITGYKWSDGAWIDKRGQWNAKRSPLNIYEVHLGSWKRDGSEKNGDGGLSGDEGVNGTMMNYVDIAAQLIPYVKDMGYTHIELLPVMEHPLDMSWGYQVSGYFAATSRYGKPEDLMAFIDQCHQNNIGVILDWVPAHFPKDEMGLRLFDGTPCFEHPDPRRGEMPTWGTCMFDMARGEVRSFLKSSADFWLRYYHADGLRVDAVSSMLYYDFCREPGQWTPNRYGGHENLEGISFLQELNQTCNATFPGTLMIAEESHAYPGVTRPVSEGGLGFNFKWNMGWMNDMLSYIKLDPVYRKWHHDKLTFSLFYAFDEDFILPFSHDEVVHGKQSMLDKQPGDIWKKFAGLRALYGYTMGHPGKKLLFMGSEIGQFIEWKFNDQLDWFLLMYDRHPQLQDCVRKLNHLYSETPALYEVDDGWDGFQWLQADDKDNSVVAFVRTDRSGRAMVCVTNFTPVFHPVYRMGLPVPGELTEVLNTDRAEFGGSNQYNAWPCKSIAEEQSGFPYAVDICIPPMSTVFFRYDKHPEWIKKPEDEEEEAVKAEAAEAEKADEAAADTVEAPAAEEAPVPKKRATRKKAADAEAPAEAEAAPKKRATRKKAADAEAPAEAEAAPKKRATRKKAADAEAPAEAEAAPKKRATRKKAADAEAPAEAEAAPKKRATRKKAADAEAPAEAEAAPKKRATRKKAEKPDEGKTAI